MSRYSEKTQDPIKLIEINYCYVFENFSMLLHKIEIISLQIFSFFMKHVPHSLNCGYKKMLRDVSHLTF